MNHFCPAYPRPREKRASVWAMFFSTRRSWMDALYERSYRMRLGEVHLPGVDIYMANEPELVDRVLSTEAQHFPKSAQLHEALKPLLGESIFTTNGAQWARQRRMMEPAFSQTRLNVA
ncbi:MAG: cytochrome P450, partial [Pseudomonadota bacterium]